MRRCAGTATTALPPAQGLSGWHLWPSALGQPGYQHPLGATVRCTAAREAEPAKCWAWWPPSKRGCHPDDFVESAEHAACLALDIEVDWQAAVDLYGYRIPLINNGIARGWGDSMQQACAYALTEYENARQAGKLP